MTELDRILELTDRIENLVAEANWADAAALEGERRALLREYIESNPQSATDLRAIQVRARDTLRLATQQRKGLVSESDNYLNRARAMRAYLDRAHTGPQRQPSETL